MGLKVIEETIYIGECELALRPTSLAGVDRALAALEKLPLEELVPAFLKLADSTRLTDAEKVIIEEKAAKRLGDEADADKLAIEVAKIAGAEQNKKLLATVPEFITVAKPILGRQMMPAIIEMILAVCESPHMVKQLMKKGKIKEDADFEVDEDDAFVGCKALRKWVKNHILGIDQAVDLLIAGLKVNDIAGSVGKLIARMMPGQENTPEAKTETASA